MNLKYRLFILFFVAGCISVLAFAHAQDKFRLKPGAKGKLCLNCHANFQERLKSPFVHTPVKTGECTGCHSPHVSSHGKLLASEASKVCYRCHSAVIPQNARSSHKVVVDGNCVKCHDPHAANNKSNLLKAGNELCFGCHKEMGVNATKIKFKHNPVEKGCLNCHNPHASTMAGFLLKDNVPSLCLQCHKADKPSFINQHMKYPVANARCTTCHNPHGSDKAGILFDNVHRPVANKMCSQCHEEPTSQNPFSTKKAGYELCRGCHSNMINETFSKNRVHWSLLGKKSCLNCHNPHASVENSLLKSPLIDLCGKCHSDAIERQERSQTKHPPIKEGKCTKCHSHHGSDNIFLLNQPVIDLCGTCHDWQKHSTHPIGEKVKDPRNKNLNVSCLSCHRSHGTENKHFIYFSQISEMCTQCHIQYKR